MAKKKVTAGSGSDVPTTSGYGYGKAKTKYGYGGLSSARQHSFLQCSCGKEYCRVCAKEIENVCVNCGLPEEKLTTFCYGEQLSKRNDKCVRNGTLDFTENGWVNIDKDGNSQKQHSEKIITWDSLDGVQEEAGPDCRAIVDDPLPIMPETAPGPFTDASARAFSYGIDEGEEDVQFEKDVEEGVEDVDGGLADEVGPMPGVFVHHYPQPLVDGRTKISLHPDIKNCRSDGHATGITIKTIKYDVAKEADGKTVAEVVKEIRAFPC